MPADVVPEWPRAQLSADAPGLPLTCTFEHEEAVHRRSARIPGARRGGIAGDSPGRHRGQRVDERRRRCTAVEMSTCRQQKNAYHPQSANMPTWALSSGKGPDPQLPHV